MPEIRLLQVIHSLMIGGSECVARDIALNIGSDFDNGVVALDKDGPLREVFESNHTKTFIINRQPHERLRSMSRLWKAIRDFKPEVVHTHHLNQLVYALPGALLAGARLIHTEHEYFSLMFPRSLFLLRQLSRFCCAVTAVNQEIAAFLRKQVGIPSHKIHTVVNGIDIERYRPRTLPREELGLTEDDLVVGIVARLHPVKDHAMLIKAFRLVVDKQPMAKLLVIGDGAERQYLQQQTEEIGLGEHISFLGPRSDVPNLLACLDVAVLSSREEGLPLFILEAMAAAKPVVATRVGGIPAVVLPGKTGTLVNPGDDRSMASALLSLLNNKEQGDRMGINGRLLIEQHYDLRKSVSAYASLYKAAAN